MNLCPRCFTLESTRIYQILHTSQVQVTLTKLLCHVISIPILFLAHDTGAPRGGSGLLSSDIHRPRPTPVWQPSSSSPAKLDSNFGCRSVKVKDYHLGYGMTIKVSMIHNMAMHYLFRVEDLSSTVLMLTLLTGNFATYFIIPDPGKMQKVEQSLTYPHFRRMRRQLLTRWSPVPGTTQRHPTSYSLNNKGPRRLARSWGHSHFELPSRLCVPFSNAGQVHWQKQCSI